jgi:Cu/Ag efflux protein CusF
VLAAMTLTFVLLAGCASRPAGQVQNVVEVRATILAIDYTRRLVTLQNEQGEQIITEVSEAVDDLDKVKVGDLVVAAYSTTITWKVRPKDHKVTAFTADPPATAAPGDQVTGSVVKSTSTIATLAAIDLDAGTATLAWPDRSSMTVRVHDPSNLRKVKVGDEVDILYSEGFAVALRKAPR